MKDCIGIRRETKDKTEHRAPLTPAQVKRLIDENYLTVIVEPSDTRVFSDKEYRAAGAKVSKDLSSCNLILGVKEVPIADLLPNQRYLFFSHTIKAQPYNMKMLKAIADKGITLMDYELITNDEGRRLVFFGNFAGYAGLINTLWTVGQRMKKLGVDSPFTHLKQTSTYDSLADAETALDELGDKIITDGLPEELTPFVCGFTGYGQVSKGAQKMYKYLPVIHLQPDELAGFYERGDFSNRHVYSVEFYETDMFEPIDVVEPFDLLTYFSEPERYQGRFEEHLPYLSAIVNGIYWAPEYPRLVTQKGLKAAFKQKGGIPLKAIGDITCDIEGSIEMTVKATTSRRPTYVYNPANGEVTDGFDGKGVAMMTIDKLPAELPREATEAFGDSLLQFLPALAAADYDDEIEDLEIDAPMKRAVITHNGELMERFEHLREHIV
ncbi:MAG: bifunctional lysine ketoglutarate reductase /saccharopine dehydrogenase family protein [Calditrichia bacterium]